MRSTGEQRSDRQWRASGGTGSRLGIEAVSQPAGVSLREAGDEAAPRDDVPDDRRVHQLAIDEDAQRQPEIARGGLGQEHLSVGRQLERHLGVAGRPGRDRDGGRKW
jgi:hypothetical protein